MFRILHNTSWDFVGRWKIALVTVALFVVPATIMVPAVGFKYSVEFTGGVEMRLRYEQAPALADVRAALTAAGVLNAEVTTFGSDEEIRIRAQDRSAVDAQASGAEAISIEIERVLKAAFGETAFERLSADSIGPRVGAELRRNAIIATLIAFVLSLIYLAWRFEWRFGVAAVVATLHDSFATLAFLMYMDIEISLFVVGSILTVVGYSMNDTVVVFDRVRENLRRNRKSNFSELINRSINETLPRTVMTSTTTVAALLALLFFGGSVMRPFALVLTFGIVVGTFSSMWVGAPLLIWLEKKWPRTTDATPQTRAAAATKA
jgi:preprotein translocase subunit SecF